MTSTAQYAYHYTARLGWGLVPIPKGQKRPVTQDWQHNPITDPQQARQVWASGQNMGLLHSASGTCTIDVDHLEYLKMAAAALDFPLMDVIESAPLKIKGKNGSKPLYRVPEGVTLPFHKLVWPHETERLENGRPRTVTVIEFRAGAGKQDVLPPSIHPDTHQPYEWVGTPPRSREDIPELPADLLAFWMALDAYLPTMKAACPWAEPEAPQQGTTQRHEPFTGESAIEAFNNRYTVQDVLARNGYKQRGSRWLSPNSSTKLPGVTLYDDNGKTRAVSHHGSDQWANGHGHDAFSLFVELECNGSLKDALEVTRQEFGLERPEFTLPTPTITAEQAVHLWDEHGSDVLGSAGEYIAARPIHHHAREALTTLTAYIFQAASEGQLSGHGSTFALTLGGIRNLAALVGGRPADCKARLEWLASNGLIAGLRRVNPENPTSGIVIDLPADPRQLPFLKFGGCPTTPGGRPQTKYVRDSKNRGSEVYSTHGTTSKAYAVGRVNSENTKNPLRALLSLVLCIGRNKNIGLKSISQKLGMRLNTVRRKWAELQELGYLDVGGNLTCTVDQFFQDMRACGAEGARKRLINTLGRQRDYAAWQLSQICFGEVPAKEKTRFLKMRKRCEDQLQRLYDGEAPHAVIGRAA